MTTPSKHQLEQWVFLQFCQAAGITVLPETLSQPDPPDIEVIVVGQGRVSFELVRLNDPDDLKGRSLSRSANELVEHCFTDLEPGRRQALEARYQCAQIMVGFVETHGNDERRKAMAFVWTLLESLPDGYDGEVHLQCRGAPKALGLLYVTRSEQIMDGPWLRTTSMGGAYPLHVEQIGKKLATRYSKAIPLELLAYIERGEIQHADAKQRIQDEVTAKLPGSSFRAVWVFEQMHRQAWKVVP